MSNEDDPIEKGDRITAEFANLGKKGDPMFHYGDSDFVVFVDEDAISRMDTSITLGDEYDLIITKVKESCAFAAPAEVYEKFYQNQEDDS